MMNFSKITKSPDFKNISVLFLCVAVVYFILWSFTGQKLLEANAFNSFSLQADAWLHGRLDLGADYPHLELAIFDGKYYVSFPPLPSVIMLPFTLIYGVNTPDNIINLFFVFVSVYFAYKTAKNFMLPDESAIIVTLFYVLGSNMTFLLFRGWVWFLAQTMGFAFCTASLYFATTPRFGDSWPAFLFLALAIGCRPFQAVYIIITIYLIFIRFKTLRADLKTGALIAKFIPRLALMSAPAFLICGFYAALNYARFGNIFEFGHNYLPEFVKSPEGQFSFSYLRANLALLVSIPRIINTGLDYPKFDGFSIFMVYPMITLSLPVAVRRLVGKSGVKHYKSFIVLCLVSVAAHIILLCSHKTMGGWHFGNRYPADCLPYIYLLFLSLADYNSGMYNRLCLPFFIFGFMLNAAGTIVAYRA